MAKQTAMCSAAFALSIASLGAPAAAPALDEARARELVRLVRQDCGSCHGMALKGGLGPPLLPESLAGKPVDSLIATVLRGRPGTPMPPWDRFLSADEAQWVVEVLRRGFPTE